MINPICMLYPKTTVPNPSRLTRFEQALRNQKAVRAKTDGRAFQNTPIDKQLAWVKSRKEEIHDTLGPAVATMVMAATVIPAMAIGLLVTPAFLLFPGIAAVLTSRLINSSITVKEHLTDKVEPFLPQDPLKITAPQIIKAFILSKFAKKPSNTAVESSHFNALT
ncbi:MAG: hypothetical protein AAGI66_01620 [Cyanobacteria bacterium P01_H01_bin.74]